MPTTALKLGDSRHTMREPGERSNTEAGGRDIHYKKRREANSAQNYASLKGGRTCSFLNLMPTTVMKLGDSRHTLQESPVKHRESAPNPKPQTLNFQPLNSNP